MTPELLSLENQRELGQRPLHEELRRQGGDREIEAAQPQARKTEHQPDRRRDQPSQDDGHEQRQAGDAQVEVVGGEGADRHEGRRAERNLTRVTGQHVQADGRQRQREERQEDRLEQIVRTDEGITA